MAQGAKSETKPVAAMKSSRTQTALSFRASPKRNRRGPTERQSPNWVIVRNEKQKNANRDIVPSCTVSRRYGTSRAVTAFGLYLSGTAGRGLSDVAKVLLFAATRDCDKSSQAVLMTRAELFTPLALSRTNKNLISFNCPKSSHRPLCS
jgi:hypothetical protein